MFSIRAATLHQFIAATLFITVFPAFFIYHYLTHFGLPPVLGGYIAAASALTGAISLLILAFQIQAGKASLSYIDIAFLMSITWKLFVSAFSYSTARYEVAAEQSVAGLIIYALIYVTIRYISQYRKDMRLVFVVSLAAMMAIYLAASNSNSFVLGVTSQAATYQSFALILLFTAFVSIMESKGAARLLIGASATIVLFLLGARTEFFIALVFLAALSATQHRVLAMILASAFVLLANSVQLDSRVREAAGMNNRVIHYLEHRSRNQGPSARDAATETALDTIAQHPISGSFASYPPGLYSHDILSAWVDYGLIGFLLHTLLFAAAYFELYRRRRKLAPVLVLVATMLSLCLVAELALKANWYLLTAMVLSYISTLSTERRPADQTVRRRRATPRPPMGV